MNYFSLNNKAPISTFKNAVIKGIAPDRGLYFPERITKLDPDFFKSIEDIPNDEIAYQAIKQFIEPEIPETDLRTIVTETLSFEFPVVPINEHISTLELFHGPTMAFKDVGARFMARCLGYFNKDSKREVTVLVATSGDTGGAVAHGFLGVEGVKVVILYPSGKVSDIQEKQLTTLGKNITALEVDGVFDDCQAMVKSAFLDEDITNKRQLTSANSINVARWLPQMFYYLFAYKQLKSKTDNIVFSVPSGNYGNICAGFVAQKLGMPAKHFIASNNINDVVPRYFESGKYEPLPSHQTISNAMDVGDPSNFVRIQQLFDNDFDKLKTHLSSYSFTDENTKDALMELYNTYGYIADPHGAVGFLGAKEYLKSHPSDHVTFLETAHPTKFLDTVETVIGTKVELPPQILEVMDKKKVATSIATYEDLKSFLLNTSV